MSDFMQEKEGRSQAVQWDIQVSADTKRNTVEYKPGSPVVIRANSIGFALSLVQRGRELVEKYS